MRKTIGELFIEYELSRNIVTRCVLRKIIASRLNDLEATK